MTGAFVSFRHYLSYFRRELAICVVGTALSVALVLTIATLLDAAVISIRGQFDALGRNTLSIIPHLDNRHIQGGPPPKLTAGDMAAIESRIGGLSFVVPSLRVNSYRPVDLRWGVRRLATTILATEEDYRRILAMDMADGRFLSAVDAARHSRVAVVGSDVPPLLGMTAPVVGRDVEIAGQLFLIVGVMQPQSQLTQSGRNNFVLIPFDVGRSLIVAKGEPNIEIIAQVAQPGATDHVATQIAQLLRLRHEVATQAEDDFLIVKSEGLIGRYERFSQGLYTLFGSIIATCLLVAGFNVSGGITVIVLQRIPEIGIRKALGARDRDILVTLMGEVSVLLTAAALMGVLLGFVTAHVAGLVFPVLVLSFDPAVAAATAAAAVLTGLAGAAVPVRAAARLEPMSALKGTRDLMRRGPFRGGE
ncbi:putative ABC transport system permease protein [Azospirillum fermentarium]|uniref:ABC transporter permease n=1 Tax=Azospirillum fermentarium TaxID=1233114 RepID=UPI002226BB6E|nr:ABC transporter permease [Azospirillum fermentarium]MCW2246935.1 putative ABC transport system permease protein [Azospirillum fermentarium]